MFRNIDGFSLWGESVVILFSFNENVAESNALRVRRTLIMFDLGKLFGFCCICWDLNIELNLRLRRHVKRVFHFIWKNQLSFKFSKWFLFSNKFLFFFKVVGLVLNSFYNALNVIRSSFDLTQCNFFWRLWCRFS